MQQYQNKQTLTAAQAGTNINGLTIQLSAAEIHKGGLYITAPSTIFSCRPEIDFSLQSEPSVS